KKYPRREILCEFQKPMFCKSGNEKEVTSLKRRGLSFQFENARSGDDDVKFVTVVRLLLINKIGFVDFNGKIVDIEQGDEFFARFFKVFHCLFFLNLYHSICFDYEYPPATSMKMPVEKEDFSDASQSMASA